ncbi:MAG: putative toxin-antitoxin system toxin component, PIN family [Proteobacteria bacterium]|nr:MAG: putative toxin-antitoxin system toxin component, PIN family [Pseudomonadota bacterium]
MLIVLDTNVIVAALRSRDGASFQILNAIINNRVEFALSVPLLLEYEAVLKRPETLLAASLKTSDMDTILNMLCARGQPKKLHYLWRPQLKDDQDEMVLELAVNAGADAIVTFNHNDFLPAATKFDMPIIMPSKYYQYLKENKI